MYSGDETLATPDDLLGDEPYEAEFDMDDTLFTDGCNVTGERRRGSGGFLW